MARVIIGIQARSNSKRLPNKIHLDVNGKSMLDHILKAANQASNYLNRQKRLNYSSGQEYPSYDVEVWLLTPTKDMINELYKRKAKIYSLDFEDDVLSRYVLLSEETNCDYIVRITADCVHLPTHMISRAIKTAVIKSADYVSNVVYRTSPEGFDVEVFSRKMVNYLHDKTNDLIEYREHVSSLLVKDMQEKPEYYAQEFKIWHLFEHYDFSPLKLSIDTAEELAIARRNLASVASKKLLASKSGFISE